MHVFICSTYCMIQFGTVMSMGNFYFLAFLFSEKVGFTCYFQTFILNSSKKVGDTGFPFGYLKASSNLQTVNLFVMPYNFPVLFPIVGKNIASESCKYVNFFFCNHWQWVFMESLSILSLSGIDEKFLSFW